MAAIRLSRLPGVGAAKFKELLLRFVLPSTALDEYLLNLPAKAKTLPPHSRLKSSTKVGLAAAEDFIARGGLVVYFGGKGYPSALVGLSEPPPVLFIRGLFPEQLGVAVVGTRKADFRGIEIARRVAERVVASGRVVVSGGATGIDAAAHEAALSSGGSTIAVLGTGVDVAFPASHYGLFNRVAAQGAVISELLPGTAPRRGFFPTRNRIIAGLSEETIVVQAPARSGACLTARLARRFGRIVSVVVPPGTGPEWAGNLLLLNEGADPVAFV